MSGAYTYRSIVNAVTEVYSSGPDAKTAHPVQFDDGYYVEFRDLDGCPIGFTSVGTYLDMLSANERETAMREWGLRGAK